MNICSRCESYSFLSWKRNNWTLSKASTSESVNQNFRLARLFVLYTKDMQSNCCTKEGFDSFLWWWWWWWCLIWHLAVLESCWFQTTVEPPLTANSPQWPPLYNGHCTYLVASCLNLSITATSWQRQLPLKHVRICQFFQRVMKTSRMIMICSMYTAAVSINCLRYFCEHCKPCSFCHVHILIQNITKVYLCIFLLSVYYVWLDYHYEIQ